MSFISSKMSKKRKVFGATIEQVIKVNFRLTSPKLLFPLFGVVQEDGCPVPHLLSLVAETVARPENIVTQGLYRQNGNMAIIQGLK